MKKFLLWLFPAWRDAEQQLREAKYTICTQEERIVLLRRELASAACLDLKRNRALQQAACEANDLREQLEWARYTPGVTPDWVKKRMEGVQ